MFARNGVEGLVCGALPFTIKYVIRARIAYGKICTSGAGVVCRGDRQRIGVSTGGTSGLHAHIVGIQIATVAGIGGPGAGVACGNGNHNVLSLIHIWSCQFEG